MKVLSTATIVTGARVYVNAVPHPLLVRHPAMVSRKFSQDVGNFENLLLLLLSCLINAAAEASVR